MKTGKSLRHRLEPKSAQVWLKVPTTVWDFWVSSHWYNKWIYSVRVGARINQQRCCIVWNATINHSGLMSGRGKGQWCKRWRRGSAICCYLLRQINWDLSDCTATSNLLPLTVFLTLSCRGEKKWRNRCINITKRGVMGHICRGNWLKGGWIPERPLQPSFCDFNEWILCCVTRVSDVLLQRLGNSRYFSFSLCRHSMSKRRLLAWNLPLFSFFFFLFAAVFIWRTSLSAASSTMAAGLSGCAIKGKLHRETGLSPFRGWRNHRTGSSFRSQTLMF